MRYDMVWFVDENKDQALAMVKRIPDAEVSERELWDCHGLRFKLRTPIPDENGRITAKAGVCVQPNLYGSESLSGSLVETRDGGKFLCLARFAKFEVLESGTVGAIFDPLLFSTPEFVEAASQSRADEGTRLGAVKATREKLMAERLEAATPVVLRWARAVGILAGVPEPDNLDPQDATDLYDVMKLGRRGLAALQEYVAESGILPAIREPQLSADPLAEARAAAAEVRQRMGNRE